MYLSCASVTCGGWVGGGVKQVVNKIQQECSLGILHYTSVLH